MAKRKPKRMTFVVTLPGWLRAELERAAAECRNRPLRDTAEDILVQALFQRWREHHREQVSAGLRRYWERRRAEAQARARARQCVPEVNWDVIDELASRERIKATAGDWLDSRHGG